MRKSAVLTIPDQIVNQLRKDIYSGQYKTGEAIKETDLSNRFGVSRGPVRHALLQLTKEGLLESKANVGVKVAQQPKPEVFDLIVKLRQEIEFSTMKKIFSDLDESDMEELHLILEDMKKSCEEKDVNTVFEIDFSFHEFFIKKYNDPHISELWHSITSRMMMKYSRFDDLIESYYEHKKLMDAIESGDQKLTLKLLKENIQ
ncbi:MAG: GntR family transcriptional regulator [Spirochaetales bacterium]|nr:GntR family transcriptional regulator [Spirochaetales bacterium]